MSGTIISESLQAAKRLIEFIDQCPSPYHVVEQSIQSLQQLGYQPLPLDKPWQLGTGHKFYITRNSAIIAFQLGYGTLATDGFRIISSHSDSPCWKLKPCDVLISEGKYVRLNTEVYGGPILSTWMDRPLSIAGRILVKGDDEMHPRQVLVNIDRPLLIIPNLAIHLNRSVNEGVELNKQIDMLPLAGIESEGQSMSGWLNDIMAAEAGINAGEILDFDLFVYPYEPGTILGTSNEFISAPRIDNLAMAHASLSALMAAPQAPFTQMVCIFDNEEVGSVSKQGAGSPLLKHVIERLMYKTGATIEEYQLAIYNSFMVSADMAHALHPNRPEKYDPVLRPIINQGPVIKVHAGQKYTTDGDSGAVFASICERAGVPVQRYANRSDVAGGSTLGNISTTQLDIRTVDVGNPMLAMHSARELSGTLDHLWMTQAFDALFAGDNSGID
jgi:aspartyl aminopeptidase